MKGFFSDMAQQIWTFLGLFCAWLVLTGSAKTVTGYAIMLSTTLWVGTYRLRNPKEKKEDE